jgi:hypothetical protein
MSLQKICTHAALSLMLVAPVTSQAFNLQTPQMPSAKQMAVGAAGVLAVGVAVYYGKKGLECGVKRYKEYSKKKDDMQKTKDLAVSELNQIKAIIGYRGKPGSFVAAFSHNWGSWKKATNFIDINESLDQIGNDCT